MHVLGLMSGTSADGVDAVLVDFRGVPDHPKWTLLNLVSKRYSKSLRNQIINAGQGLKLSSEEWIALSEAVTKVHFEAACACDPQGHSEMVGCHGQTVLHRPPLERRHGASWQILQASLLAQLLERPVVHDFRAADIALGGQGAPLVPMADAALLGRVGSWRAILNLGGIANLTLIPPKTGPDRSASVLGWDCGPANSLLDLCIKQFTKGELAFDHDGLIAARGTPDEGIIEAWLREPFFHLSPPKSSGREQFGVDDLERRLKENPQLSNSDFMATLTAFSAAVVAQDLEKLYITNRISPVALLVAGGGSKNPVMLSELIRRCRGMRVAKIDEYGMPVEAREALSFALFAWWHSLKHSGNSPEITGAKRAAVLGLRADPA